MIRTIVLRYGDNFAPKCGTINAHMSYIEKNGFVWFGKMGLGISKKGIDAIMDSRKALLVHSGKSDRYWLTIEKISTIRPSFDEFPEYYHDKVSNVKTWLKITNIEEAERNVISKCTLESNKRPLAEVSKASMSPYFIVNYDKNKN